MGTTEPQGPSSQVDHKRAFSALPGEKGMGFFQKKIVALLVKECNFAAIVTYIWRESC